MSLNDERPGSKNCLKIQSSLHGNSLIAMAFYAKTTEFPGIQHQAFQIFLKCNAQGFSGFLGL
jgi:hypothetical protein